MKINVISCKQTPKHYKKTNQKQRAHGKLFELSITNRVTYQNVAGTLKCGNTETNDLNHTANLFYIILLNLSPTLFAYTPAVMSHQSLNILFLD